MTAQEYEQKHAGEAGDFKSVENIGLAEGTYQMVVGFQEKDYKPMQNGLPVLDAEGKPTSIPMVRMYVFGKNDEVGADKRCTPVRIAQAALAGATGLVDAEDWQRAKGDFLHPFMVEKYVSEKADPRDPRSRDKFKYRKA